MPPKRFVCSRHLVAVVTNSDGVPTCRSCGLRPTPEEEAAGIPALVSWEEAQARVKPRRSR